MHVPRAKPAAIQLQSLQGAPLTDAIALVASGGQQVHRNRSSTEIPDVSRYFRIRGPPPPRCIQSTIAFIGRRAATASAHGAIDVAPQWSLARGSLAHPEGLSWPIDVTQGCPCRHLQIDRATGQAVSARMDAMKSKTAVIKRSIIINGQKTSVSLEKEFWEGLQAIAKQKGTTTSKLAEEIARHRTTVNLSSAIRIFVYNHYRSLEVAPTADMASLRAKAAESRTLADHARDEGARAAMLEIATDYAAIAERRKRASE